MPITRIIDVGGEKMEVAAVAQLPPGAVPAFLGVVLVVAVLIEPWLVRRRVLARLWAWLRGRPPPPIPDFGGVAIAGAQTRGTNAQARGLGKRGLAAFFYRRDAAAVILIVAALAVRPVGAAGFLGRARQHLRDAARLFRDRAAGGRPHLRHGQRRHRSLRRLGAGACPARSRR